MVQILEFINMRAVVHKTMGQTMPKSSIKVTLLAPQDEFGAIQWRMSGDVELAIQHWSREEQERLRENIKQMLSGYVHLLSAELHYAARTNTEPMQDLVATMKLFGEHQKLRSLKTRPAPPTKLH